MATSETGIVINKKSTYILVQIDKSSSCGSCHVESSCGTSTLAKLFSNNVSKPLEVINLCDANLGDKVVLQLKSIELIKHSFMAYGFPIISMLLSALLFNKLQSIINFNNEELLSVLGAILGITFSLWYTKMFYKPKLIEAIKIINKDIVK